MPIEPTRRAVRAAVPRGRSAGRSIIAGRCWRPRRSRSSPGGCFASRASSAVLSRGHFVPLVRRRLAARGRAARRRLPRVARRSRSDDPRAVTEAVRPRPTARSPSLALDHDVRRRRRPAVLVLRAPEPPQLNYAQLLAPSSARSTTPTAGRPAPGGARRRASRARASTCASSRPARRSACPSSIRISARTRACSARRRRSCRAILRDVAVADQRPRRLGQRRLRTARGRPGPREPRRRHEPRRRPVAYSRRQRRADRRSARGTQEHSDRAADGLRSARNRHRPAAPVRLFEQTPAEVPLGQISRLTYSARDGGHHRGEPVPHDHRVGASRAGSPGREVTSAAMPRIRDFERATAPGLSVRDRRASRRSS